jgi:DNA-binding transcriptional regulator YiaG
MHAKPLSHKEILKELGKRPTLARELGRAYQTVASWEARDSVPSWEWNNIAALARRKGKAHISVKLLAATAPRPKWRLCVARNSWGAGHAAD